MAMLKLQQSEYNMLCTITLASLAFWALLPSNHQLLVDAAQPRRVLQQSAGGEWHKVGDTCDKNAHCLNGGICRPADKDDGSHRHCHCQNGFSGSRCEHYCPLTCENGGYCHHLGHEHDIPTFGDNQDMNTNDYQCKCLGYFTGSLCEIPFENCLDRKQCFYGGKCRQIRRPTESGGAYIGSYCECPPERHGDACEFSMDAVMDDDPNKPLDKSQRILSGLVVGAVFFLATLIGSSLMVRRARYKAAWARTRAKEEAMIQDVIYISRYDSNVNWTNTQ